MKITDERAAEIERRPNQNSFIMPENYPAWAADAIKDLLADWREMREKLRYRRMDDEKPPIETKVILSSHDEGLAPLVCEAKFVIYSSSRCGDEFLWDHPNWNRPRDIKPDDLWLPIPLPSDD